MDWHLRFAITRQVFVLSLFAFPSLFGQSEIPFTTERDELRAGAVFIKIGNSQANALAILPLPDGKFLTAGSQEGQRHPISRWLANQVLDTSFYTTGSNFYVVSGNSVQALALQANGKIIAVGSPPSANDFAVDRFNSNGTLDTSFNSNGMVVTDINSTDRALATVYQTDGKIIAVGFVNNTSDFGLVRYNSNGTLDTSFNTEGKATLNKSGTDIPQASFLQTDGKIVIAGKVTDAADFGVARYNSNGSLDTTFNTEGITITDISGGDSLYAATLQTDGKITAAGSTSDDQNFGICRYNSNGTLDTSFFTAGTNIADLGGTENGTAAVLQTDGKTVVVGYNSANFMFARYKTDGDLDADFQATGIAVHDLGGDEFPYAMGILIDGTIVAAGPGGDGGYAIGLASVATDGTLIQSSTTLLTPGHTSIIATALASNGASFVATSCNSASSYRSDFCVTKIKPNGAIDTSFAAGGLANIELTGWDNPTSMEIQTDGKVLIGGSTENQDLALVRLMPNGDLDNDLNTSGKVIGNLGGNEYVYATKVQPDGKIVVAGTKDSDFLLKRYNTDGSDDLDFSAGGASTTDISGNDDGRCLALQTDGKMVVVGFTSNFIDIGIARYNSNGDIDTSFNQSGSLIADLTINDIALACLLQSDGKILALGRTNVDFAVVRVNSNGSFDTTFSTTGKVTTDISGGDTIYAGALLPSGKILAVGNSESQFSAVRYNSNGSLDTTFGSTGKKIRNIGETNCTGKSVNVLPDGHYLIGGSTVKDSLTTPFLIKMAP